MPKRDPRIAVGLVYASKAKRKEGELIAAYFRLGEWLRDDFPQTGITLKEFAEHSGFKRQSLDKFRKVASVYGTLDNIPEDYKMETAYKMRNEFIPGLSMPKARKAGEKPHGVEAVVNRTRTAMQFMQSALNAMNDVHGINDIQKHNIEDNIKTLRLDANDIMRMLRNLDTYRPAA